MKQETLKQNKKSLKVAEMKKKIVYIERNKTSRN